MQEIIILGLIDATTFLQTCLGRCQKFGLLRNACFIRAVGQGVFRTIEKHLRVLSPPATKFQWCIMLHAAVRIMNVSHVERKHQVPHEFRVKCVTFCDTCTEASEASLMHSGERLPTGCWRAPTCVCTYDPWNVCDVDGAT